MAVAAATNRQILLVETAKGKLGPEHFCLREAEIPLPNDGEVLLRVHYISLDAANRAWMQGATYRDAVQAGSVMAGGAVAEVVESKAAGFSPGDLVFTDTGWQDNAVLPAKRLLKLPKIQPMTHLLSSALRFLGSVAERVRESMQQCARNFHHVSAFSGH
jgi:NADPH-dependent curcumin reductase CurA